MQDIYINGRIMMIESWQYFQVIQNIIFHFETQFQWNIISFELWQFSNNIQFNAIHFLYKRYICLLHYFYFIHIQSLIQMLQIVVFRFYYVSQTYCKEVCLGLVTSPFCFKQWIRKYIYMIQMETHATCNFVTFSQRRGIGDSLLLF